MSAACVSLQFVLGRSFPSRLIAWYGQGYGGFSHVDGVLEDGSLIGARSDSVGGQPPGIRIRPSGYESWARRAVVTFPHTEELYPIYERNAKKRIGEGYDKADILGFILGISLSQPGHWICSAFQTEQLEPGGVNLLPLLPVQPQQITPNTLLLMCVAAGAHYEEFD